MIDFQSLHAKQLVIYQNFNRFKNTSSYFINLSQRKLASVRRNTLSVNKSMREPSIELPDGFRGQKVNLLI